MSDIPLARIVAMCRLLEDTGDLTPMGTRMILKLWEESA